MMRPLFDLTLPLVTGFVLATASCKETCKVSTERDALRFERATHAIQERFDGMFSVTVEGPIEYESMLADTFGEQLNTPKMKSVMEHEADRGFFESAKNGGRIWKFISDPDSWERLRGKEGYAIVSESGEIEEIIVSVRN